MQQATHMTASWTRSGMLQARRATTLGSNAVHSLCDLTWAADGRVHRASMQGKWEGARVLSQ
jgi:hypothetical protein